jgi:hypothetical protein
MRKKKYEHLVLTGKLKGSRARGRQRLTLLSLLSEQLEISNVQLLQKTMDRDAWKSHVATILNAMLMAGYKTTTIISTKEQRRGRSIRRIKTLPKRCSSTYYEHRHLLYWKNSV